MEKIKMQPTRPEDALLTDAFADFLEKCRAKNLSEKTLNIYTVHFKFFKEYLSDLLLNYKFLASNLTSIPIIQNFKILH